VEPVRQPPFADRVARLLRQQVELGSPEVILEGLTAGEVEALVAAATHGGRVGAPSFGSPAAPESPPPPDAGPRLPVLTLPDDYEALRSVALECRRCGLAETRTQVVFSDGNPSARLMVVGEAPGQQEDETGLPFVGPAGKLLDLLLASVGLSRLETVYICNVLKCRPPGNRNPRPEEIEACAPFLRRQIEEVAPEVILAVGTFSGQWLSGKGSPLGKLRGEVYSYLGTPVVVTYHPAALLRNGGWTRATWDDLQLLREVLDGA